MTKIVDELQARVAESKERLDKADKEFKVATATFQMAQQDHNVWTLALQAEVRDEQRKTAVATERQMPLPSIAKPEAVATAVPEQAPDSSEILNKTDIVRDLLKHHPNGMSAVDIWKQVRTQFHHRPYLYSVLKRLRDRQEIVKRRSRYCLTVVPKMEGVKEQSLVQ